MVNITRNGHDRIDRPQVDRSRDELMALLGERFAHYLSLSFDEQALLDEDRFLPTLEMYELLGYYLTHGKFADEGQSRWIDHRLRGVA